MADKTIRITTELTTDQAEQLAQFAKRSTFDTYYDLTEAHHPPEERKRRAYLMIDGIEAIQRTLTTAGHAPR